MVLKVCSQLGYYYREALTGTVLTAVTTARITLSEVVPTPEPTKPAKKTVFQNLAKDKEEFNTYSLSDSSIPEVKVNKGGHSKKAEPESFSMYLMSNLTC